MQFSNANKKLQKLAVARGIPAGTVFSFDLPAGHTCPGAKDCLSRSNRVTGKIKDGPDCVFRCYAASAEAMYRATREMRWRNLDSVRMALRTGTNKCAERLLWSIPRRAKVIRIHTSGDFFSAKYMKAWMQVARKRPDIQFYCYTKSLKILSSVGKLPDNLSCNVSMGGKFDSMADDLGLPCALVVSSEAAAKKRKLPIDTTDGIACSGNRKDFALLVHGTQPKGGHKLDN